MAHTEHEAKGKWCAFARTPFVWDATVVIPANRGGQWGEMAERSPCIASDCMSWRWSRAKETRAFLDEVQTRMKATGENFAKASEAIWKAHPTTFDHTEGYCGLAGKPE